MPLNISFDAATAEASISRDDSVSDSAWLRLKQTLGNADDNTIMRGNEVRLPWFSFLSSVGDLAALRRSHGVNLNPIGAAHELLSSFAADVRSTRNLSLPNVDYDRSEIPTRLIDLGFTGRILTAEQLDSVHTLLRMRNGANFSVPGSGKTTVALATHLLTAKTTTLLVVAPKNAFSAWDDVLVDCLGDSAALAEPFVRLVGGAETIRALLRSRATHYIIGYEQLSIVLPRLIAFIATNPVHLVLDESHRIKAGDASLRGSAALRLGPLAKRRDILSGTPVPNGITDIVPQIDFLWPGQNLAKSTLSSANTAAALRPYYTRITKAQLNLPPVEREFITVEMAEPQLALYGVLRSAAIRRLTMLRSGSGDFSSARSSALRLLQASSNPIAAVESIGRSSDIDIGEDAFSPLYDAVSAEPFSNKILKTGEICAKLIANDEKVVVWTVFRDTIDRLERYLESFNPAVIHGGIGSGSVDDPETREGQIARFHNDPSCGVLIANPAACSEGISLHKVCHNAIYLDRSYNAAHFLQSMDRIHRLGMDPSARTMIYILQSATPPGLGSIDYSISRRLLFKLRLMDALLDDEDIRRLALDEEDAPEPVDIDSDLDDLNDLILRLLEDPPYSIGDGA